VTSATITGLTSTEPFVVHHATVSKDQTNALGHLKASEYIRLFDDGINLFFPRAGLADVDLKHGETSPFLMDMHTCYLSELRAGEAVEIAVQHLDHDARRARTMLTLRAVTDGRLCATTELLLINMHIGERKPKPWSPRQMSLWDTLKSAHQALPILPQAGRAIGPLSQTKAPGKAVG
jgi:acyl-CoA thioester hydrolase